MGASYERVFKIIIVNLILNLRLYDEEKLTITVSHTLGNNKKHDDY